MKENREKHKLCRVFQKWKKKFCDIRGRFSQKAEEVSSECPKEPVDNPWIYATRQILEQILNQKGQTYRTFRPLIIDTDTPDQVFGEADDVDQILEQLYPGLNLLEIATERPEHFAEVAEWLAGEYGLLVRILPIDALHQSCADTVLDLQRQGELHMHEFSGDVIYVPFYKRRWCECQKTEQEKMAKAQMAQKMTAIPVNWSENTEQMQGQNLDIEVPIGYNVVIVKVDKTLQNY